MDRGAWWATVQGVAKSRARLSDFTFTFHFIHWRRKWQPTPVFLAWRIPGTGEPDGLLCMGSHRVGHDLSDLVAAAAAAIQRLYYAKTKVLGWEESCVLSSWPVGFIVQVISFL